jgi:uncharacterized protein
MARDYHNIAPHTVTRKDRAVHEDAWIKTALRHAQMGVLATVHDSQPFINMNLFVYDEEHNAITLHTAGEGRTRFNITQNNRVCFGISHMGRLLPASEALEFSVEYSGVVVFGRIEVVEDLDQIRRFFLMLFEKYAPQARFGTDLPLPPDAEFRRPTVYRIPIDAWSGKKKEAAADFPGAYDYATPDSK